MHKLKVEGDMISRPTVLRQEQFYDKYSFVTNTVLQFVTFSV